MATILERAAEGLATAWLADVPAASILAPALGAGLAAVLESAVSGSRGTGTGGSDRIARRVFGVPRGMNDPQTAGDHIARVIGGWLPDELKTCGAALATAAARAAAAAAGQTARPAGAGGDGDAANSSAGARGGSAQASATPPARLLEMMDGGPVAAELLEDLMNLGSAMQMAASSGGRWDPNRVRDLLRKLMKRLGGVSYPGMKRLLLDFDREMRELPQRIAVATVLAGLEIAAPTVRSTRAIGRAVHQTLQDRYVWRYRHRTIVAERWVYRAGRARVELPRAAAADVPGDFSLTALELARFSPFSRSGVLRDDIVDMTFWENWEVKPVLSGPIGVAQESYYRMAYNTWATFLQEVLGRSIRTRRLVGGHDWADEPGGLLAPIAVAGGAARPFALDALPGMILYWVARSLTPEQLKLVEAALMAALLALLKRELERLKKLGKAVAEAAAKVLEVALEIGRAFMELLFYVAIGLAILGAIVLAPAIGGGTLATAGAAAVVLLVAGVVYLIFREEDEQQRDDSTLAAASPAPRATVRFGGATLVDFPLERLPILMSVSEKIADRATRAGLTALVAALGDGTVPVEPLR